jgi:L-rhamnose isomerase
MFDSSDNSVGKTIHEKFNTSANYRSVITENMCQTLYFFMLESNSELRQLTKKEDFEDLSIFEEMEKNLPNLIFSN